MTLAVEGTLEPTFDGDGRRVFSGLEWQEIAIPADLLIDGDRVDVYEAVAKSQAFAIRTRGSRLYLQAGNAIGYIPVNDRVALEINSRVPLANLGRLLAATDTYSPTPIAFMRSYGDAADSPKPFLDFLTDALLAAIEGLRTEGLHKAYDRVLHHGAPSGRVLPFESALAQRCANRPMAVSARFERSTDTEANRRIKTAIVRLHGLYGGMRERAGLRKRLAALSAALAFFSHIRADQSLLSRPLDDLRHLPDNRPWLGRAVALSTLILRNAGLEVRTFKGSVIAESLLIQMEDVFEQYVRQTLRDGLDGRSGVSVHDGNLDRPAGAAGVLFHEPLSRHGNSRSTPDTVVVQAGTTAVIVETKYKLCPGLPERDHINQALTYGISHDCGHVVLAYPSHDHRCLLEPLGRIGTVRLYKAGIPLAHPDMDEAEAEFSRLIGDILA